MAFAMKEDETLDPGPIRLLRPVGKVEGSGNSADRFFEPWRLERGSRHNAASLPQEIGLLHPKLFLA
jgi:hypothetical protein